MQRFAVSFCCGTKYRSNPHPARKPDATRWQRCRSTQLMFQSSSSPKAGCNGVHLKPADINRFNKVFRDPIIPHIFRHINIPAQNRSNPYRQSDREPPRKMTITTGSRRDSENQWLLKISITINPTTK
jgi:hypothetical protein